jgi:PAS domain S-box-containing protein
MLDLKDFEISSVIRQQQDEQLLQVKSKADGKEYLIRIQPLSTAQDITQLPDNQKAGQELAKKELYFRTLIEKSFDVTFICNEEELISYASPSTEFVLGYKAKDLIGTDGAIVFTHDSWEVLKQGFNWLGRFPGKVLRRQLKLCTRKDGHIDVELVAKNLLDDEAVKGYLIMFRDISERTEAEEILRNYNIILKREVENHTEELKEKNTELEKLLHELKEAQVQLIQSEKLASLGQLTAGIAHEVNNPINFVSANIGPLKTDMNEIKLLLERYRELHTSHNLQADLEQVNQLRQELDVDYLLEEINALLGGIEEGAKRTKEIVAGLKDFARVDEEALKAVNLHDGLESTLKLINSHLRKSNITVKREYGALPVVDCYPGKINQVFMNIFTNAMQAIGKNGTITIRTWAGNEKVYVAIKDTGAGMTAEVKEKIFEPFFTNKKVGEGTGLGLSISYSIVQSHKGSIEVISMPGEGAEFIISLPIRNDDPAS